MKIDKKRKTCQNNKLRKWIRLKEKKDKKRRKRKMPCRWMQQKENA